MRLGLLPEQSNTVAKDSNKKEGRKELSRGEGTEQRKGIPMCVPLGNSKNNKTPQQAERAIKAGKRSAAVFPR